MQRAQLQLDPISSADRRRQAGGPSIGTIAGALYLTVGASFFLSVADNALGRLHLLPVPATTAALLFLAPGVGLVALYEIVDRPSFRRVGRLLSLNSFVIYPFLLTAFFSLIFALHPTAFWADKAKWIYITCYGFLIFLSATLLPLIDFMARRYRTVFFVSLLSLLASILTDVLAPGTFSGELNRAAGFPGNSNWSALTLVMLAAATMRYDTSRSSVSDLLILALVAVGVFSTLSRSGMMNLLLLSVFYFTVTLGTGVRRAHRIAVTVMSAMVFAAALSIVLPVLISETQLFSGSKAVGRIAGLFHGRIVDDGSSSGRMNAAAHAIELIEESPIVGHGTGFSRTMPEKPHNQYLHQWVNNGLPGLLSYIALLAGAWWTFAARKYYPGMGLVIVTAFGSFFSHNILDQRTFLMLLGILCTVSVLRPSANEERQPAARQRRAHLPPGLGLASSLDVRSAPPLRRDRWPEHVDPARASQTAAERATGVDRQQMPE